MRTKLILLLLLIISLPAFSSLLRAGYFPMHDDMQAMRLLQMDKCVKDGQIPCRWVPDMGYGYGYPQFNYYSPLPYYLMEGFHLLGFPYLNSVKVFFVLSVIVSFCGMFLLGRNLWGGLGGFLSALLYIYVPYRAVDMYVRGAVGELAAFSIIPFIFLYVKKIIDGEKKAILGAAIAFSTLLASHNISSVMILPFLAAWIVFFYLQTKRLIPFRRILKNISVSFLWGLGMSAFFVFPAYFEKNLVHIDSLTGGYFNYINHFVGLKTLLFSNYWGYGFSEVGRFDELNLSVGIIHLFLAFLGLSFLYFWGKKKEYKIPLFLIVAAGVGIFMIHPRSLLVWKSISVLEFFQFPWRFLLITSFLLSLAGGSVKYISETKKSQKILVISILSLLLIFYASFFKPRQWLNISDKEKFSGASWTLQQTVSILDYLPIFAKSAPSAEAPVTPIFDGDVLNSEIGTNWQNWLLDTSHVNTVVSLPVFYFPNWRVEIDGKNVPVFPKGDLGLVSFNMESGQHSVYAHLEDTPIRKWSNLLSVAALAAIPLYLKRKK